MVRAVDGQLAIGNFGMAAEGMKLIKSIKVPQDMREGLRKRYALCQIRGYVNSVLIPNNMICYGEIGGGGGRGGRGGDTVGLQKRY